MTPSSFLSTSRVHCHFTCPPFSRFTLPPSSFSYQILHLATDQPSPQKEPRPQTINHHLSERSPSRITCHLAIRIRQHPHNRLPSPLPHHISLQTHKTYTNMPPKKIRCSFKECSVAAQRIVGDCGFCQGHFCGKHRLLEDHKCDGLEDVSSNPESASAFEWWQVGVFGLVAGDDNLADTLSSANSARRKRTRRTLRNSTRNGRRSSRVSKKDDRPTMGLSDDGKRHLAAKALTVA